MITKETEHSHLYDHGWLFRLSRDWHAKPGGDEKADKVGEDSLEEDLATHSSICAWRIPWTEEPGRL